MKGPAAQKETYAFQARLHPPRPAHRRRPAVHERGDLLDAARSSPSSRTGTAAPSRDVPRDGIHNKGLISYAGQPKPAWQVARADFVDTPVFRPDRRARRPAAAVGLRAARADRGAHPRAAGRRCLGGCGYSRPTPAGAAAREARRAARASGSGPLNGLLTYLVLLAASGLIVGALRGSPSRAGPDVVSADHRVGLLGSLLAGLISLALFGGENAGGLDPLRRVLDPDRLFRAQVPRPGPLQHPPRAVLGAKRFGRTEGRVFRRRAGGRRVTTRCVVNSPHPARAPRPFPSMPESPPRATA